MKIKRGMKVRNLTSKHRYSLLRISISLVFFTVVQSLTTHMFKEEKMRRSAWVDCGQKDLLGTESGTPDLTSWFKLLMVSKSVQHSLTRCGKCKGLHVMLMTNISICLSAVKLHKSCSWNCRLLASTMRKTLDFSSTI